MKDYGLTIADPIAIKAKPAKERVPTAVKHRDDATGDTWVGRGRSPKWFQGKDKNQYLVK